MSRISAPISLIRLRLRGARPESRRAYPLATAELISPG